jgi:pimeloyl-ACP methyl ester carboxylesterase
MTRLESTARSVSVQKVAAGRFIAYLPGPDGGPARRLRLVGGDHAAYATQVVRAIEAAVAEEPDSRVMLVGSAQGGVAAAEVASFAPQSRGFVVEQVVTAGAPSAQVPRLPEGTHMLSLEDRADPVALLGPLVNAGDSNRMTVVFESNGDGASMYVAGARAADSAPHPELRAEISRIQGLGYLAG